MGDATRGIEQAVASTVTWLPFGPMGAGVTFATNGCIRTTDEATGTGAIRLLERSGDPITTMTVEH